MPHGPYDKNATTKVLITTHGYVVSRNLCIVNSRPILYKHRFITTMIRNSLCAEWQGATLENAACSGKGNYKTLLKRWKIQGLPTVKFSFSIYQWEGQWARNSWLPLRNMSTLSDRRKYTQWGY